MGLQDRLHQKGIKLTTFAYYRGLIKKPKNDDQGSDKRFKPIKLVKKNENEGVLSGEIRLSLPNGFQCAFPMQLDVVQIKNLVEVLLSC